MVSGYKMHGGYIIPMLMNIDKHTQFGVKSYAGAWVDQILPE